MEALEAVTTQDLIDELAERHTDLIVIRESLKAKNGEFKVYVKTKCQQPVEIPSYNLIRATEMLTEANLRIVEHFLTKGRE